jgi:hypothetical protein
VEHRLFEKLAFAQSLQEVGTAYMRVIKKSKVPCFIPAERIPALSWQAWVN